MMILLLGRWAAGLAKEKVLSLVKTYSFKGHNNNDNDNNTRNWNA